MTSSGTGLLYMISKTKLPFLTATVDLYFGLVILPDINTVSEVRLGLDGEDYTFTLHFGEEENSNGLRELKSIKVSAGDPVLTIEYDYQNKDKESTIVEGYAVDARTMQFTLNGESDFTGRFAYVNKPKTELAHLLAGR